MVKPVVELKNISKTFGGIKALKNVSLTVYPGEVHALVGENGAGKSTLMKVLAGVHYPDEGAQFFISGEQTVIKNPMDAIRRGIAVIYQDISLFPNLSVAENIGFANEQVWGKKLNWMEIRKLARKALDEIEPGLDIDTRLGELSIASQQIVAIARAISFNSKVIIMDEPTSSLSSSEVKKLYEIVDKMREKGLAVIFISHKFDEIFRLSDRVTVLRDGTFIDSMPISEVDESKLIKLMVGRDVEYLTLKGKNIKNEEVFKVEGLTKKGNFGDISFNLRKGEILGITGLVGSGRTELAKAIFGLNKQDSGSIYLNGKKLDLKDSREAIDNGIAYVPENRQLEGLVLQETLSKNMMMPIMERIKKGIFLDKEKERILSDEKIKELDVRPANRELLASQLSGGNQQKVVIGKWLLTNPKLLIVDEPTNGVDIGAKVAIHKLLRKVADEGVGVIVISSELPEILALSDRVMVMKHGNIGGFINRVEDMTQEKIMNIALGTK